MNTRQNIPQISGLITPSRCIVHLAISAHICRNPQSWKLSPIQAKLGAKSESGERRVWEFRMLKIFLPSLNLPKQWLCYTADINPMSSLQLSANERMVSCTNKRRKETHMEEEWTWENNGIEKVGPPNNGRERKQSEVGADSIFRFTLSLRETDEAGW